MNPETLCPGWWLKVDIRGYLPRGIAALVEGRPAIRWQHPGFVRKAMERADGAAPDLYSRTQGIGPWSDTYGAAATLYRMLTGSAPEKAPDRLEKDTLEPPSGRGANVPHHVDQVVVTALALRGEQRYSPVRELRDALPEPVKRRRTVR